MKRKLSPVAIFAIVAGVLAYAAAGYFLVVGPQRGKSADVEKQIVSTQSQIDQYRMLALKTKTATPIRVAELFRLTKAMPDDADMSGVLLELSRVAAESGIEFNSITPQGAATVSGYTTIPITLEFDGNYYELSDFLFRLRNLVRVHSGRLEAQGRLFEVDSIGFSESPRAFPEIKASLTVHAFSFGDTAAALASGTPPAAAATTTTPPNEAPATDSGATAAGAGTP